jgi:hypothetical protein
MIYGPHGLGKSTFGAMAPGHIFIQTEDGLDNIECASLPKATTFHEVMEQLGALYTDDHDYKAVVIDSVDFLERLIWDHVCKERNVDNIEDIGYAKGYTFAITHWETVLTGLDALRNDRDMMIILIAHAKIERFENPETDAYDRYSPKLHKHASALLQEWCDEVLFCNYKVHTTQTEEGFGKKRNRAIGDGERIIRTTERPSHLAKNRLNMPPEIPLNYNDYAEFFKS